jgi:hypothetical protein
MEQVEIEITGQAITAQYGTLNSGAVLRTSPEFARHLVEDCSVAKYRGANAKQVEHTPTATSHPSDATTAAAATPAADPGVKRSKARK